MNYSNIEQIYEMVNITFNLYRDYGGSDYIGENITQLEHALQCAHQASIDYPDNNAIILGAFLHDVGHLISLHDIEHPSNKLLSYNNESLNGLGLINHENVGANFLDNIGYPKIVGDLGRYHVMAKRYLVTRDSEYLNNLSDASKETFKLQGGVLSESELENFDNNEHKELFIKMRNWDDRAKDVNFKYEKNINDFENMALALMFGK